MLFGLIAVAACSGSPLVDSTIRSSTQTLQVVTTTTTAATVAGPIRGALPDGTIYDIAFPKPRDERIGDIQAELVAEVDGAEIPLVVSFRTDGAGDSDAGLSFPAGDWTVEIAIPGSLDEDARGVVKDAIEVSTEVEMPVITLEPPLRWSDAPQVRYDSFVVQSGCPEEAAACNVTHAVSVIPHPGTELEAPISVQSYALRPRSDGNYLPPGPLTARWAPDVVWTGDEMIVWGGSTNPGPPQLIEGAAYDPVTNDWRMLSQPPLAREQATRAVWAEPAMIVIGEEATLAWAPERDEWRIIADGLVPPMEPGLTVAAGSQIVTWTPDGLHWLVDDEWEQMPDPGIGEPGLEGSVLRALGSRLFAIGKDGCDRLITQWDGAGWTEPVRVSLEASPPVCGNPSQTAAVNGVLVMWDDTSGVVVSHDPSSDVVAEHTDFPLPETEHAPGPVALDDGFLVTAGLDGAIFDPANGRWATFELPGLSSDVATVWTGEEVLMWDKCCYGPDDVDAWRWVPPSR